jgi:flagellar hook-associated protein 1 FlgK
MSLSSLLFASRDALTTQQMAINVTGANIANVDTPGYTRQRAEIKSTGMIDIAANSVQLGIAVSRIERLYDRYIEAQTVDQRQNSGYSDEMLRGLQNIEVLLDNTSGGGLSDKLNKFWAAWENLSNNPAGQVERSDLLASAQNMTTTINSYQSGLHTINTDMNRNITDVISRINDKAVEISQLNAKIIDAAGDTGNNNALRDKRLEALKELAGLVNVNWIEDASGALSVYLSNGDPLVQGATTRALRIELDASIHSNIYSASSATEPINGAVTKGTLGAYIALQNNMIPQYLDYINHCAIALAQGVNELHRSGFDLNQNTGMDFFTIADMNNAAGSIAVSSAIASNTNRIACSSTISGEGDNATKIASIQYELLMNSQTSTLNGYLATVVGQIGRQVANARTDSDRQTAVMNQLNNQRESVSGVSIDEEMINLIKYQMAYTAAGKLCVTVNEMLDTLMELLQ